MPSVLCIEGKKWWNIGSKVYLCLVFPKREKEIMDYLPQDPAILVSSVNMLLRDGEFDTLESLCYAFSREPWEVRDYLLSHGFVWSEVQKQFRPVGYDSTDAGGEEDDSR